MPTTPAVPHPPGTTRAARRKGFAGGAAIVAATLALVLGGCSSSASSPLAGPSTGASSDGSDGDPAATGPETKVTIGQVVGIAKKATYRKRFRGSVHVLEKRVGKAVDAWFDGAYVGVSYPRDSFDDAFTSFTPQAAADGRRQKALMTDWSLRHDISVVDATERQVSIDVLAPSGVIAGATARFRLAFDATGDKGTKKVTVSGRLFLTRNPHGTWQIFGFDVAKGVT